MSDDSIQLSGKNYPIRFDFRALKEFKGLTGHDVLKGFDAKDTDHIITLTYTALKSGFILNNPNSECLLTIDQVSQMISLRDMKRVIDAFLNEVKDLKSTQDESGGEESRGKMLGAA